MKSASGFGQVISSSFAIRSSYGTPSAFIFCDRLALRPVDLPRRMMSGFSRIDSTSERTRGRSAADGGSSRSRPCRAVERERLVEGEVPLQVGGRRRPAGSRSSSCATSRGSRPGGATGRASAACAAARLVASSSWQRSTSSRSDAKFRSAGASLPSASRCSSSRTIPWVRRKRDRSVSGGRRDQASRTSPCSRRPAPSAARGPSSPPSSPSVGLLLACFFSTMCSGRLATTLPASSNPSARPARRSA